ncbi:MAG: hypothetical protein KF684_13065 [Phycisphaeraceae bacterium]|nr:hypothetical protein [Phycisphaeraceae bacterium]
MSTSDKTFTQVKDILRKLDRSIDEAREKRLSHDEPVSASAAIGAARPGRDSETLSPPPNRAEPTRSSNPAGGGGSGGSAGASGGAGGWMSR